MQTFAASTRSPFSIVPKTEPGALQARPSMTAGDMVLYRAEDRQMVPAVLVQAAGGGCWLARDARNIRGLTYLAPENIAMRLEPVDADLLAEAA